MVRCCSTTSPPLISKDAAANWRNMATGRDHRGDRPQIVIGLMCTAEGCPVAVEVFEGNTADPLTLSAQIDKLKQPFHLQRVVMLGDRGGLTSARLEHTLPPPRPPPLTPPPPPPIQ